jgi:hypothetical protein
MMTSTTPLSGTVVTTHTYDAANRLTARARSDGRAYTLRAEPQDEAYDWSARGQMLTEWMAGVPVRTFTYDSAGRMTQATVFTLTTRFTYDGDGARRVVEVVGHGTTTYTVDYAAGNRILAEATLTGTLLYLYGHDCLGQYDSVEDEWLYYLNDAIGYVRQGADDQSQVTSSWLFDPDGTVLEGPQGLVSHLICGGVYDWSTGLIFKGGRYFDPTLGIWLALAPLVVIQSWRGRKKRRRGVPWYVLVVVGVGGVLTGCGVDKEQIRWDLICTEEPILGRRVYVEHVSGPNATPQGDFYWKIKFELSFAAKTDAWIIQEIYSFRFVSTNDDFYPKVWSPPDLHFFEAWPIKGGEVHRKRPHAQPYDDVFVWNTRHLGSLVVRVASPISGSMV